MSSDYSQAKKVGQNKIITEIFQYDPGKYQQERFALLYLKWYKCSYYCRTAVISYTLVGSFICWVWGKCMKSLWSNQDRGKRGAVEQLKYHRLLSEKSLKIIVAGLLLNISLSPVYAETGATQLEPITVIGEKVARSIQDTVSSVGVLTAEDIEDGGMLDINNAFERIVNVSSTFGGEGFSIRGINNNTVAGGATTGSGLASLYIDGAFIPSFGIRVGQKQLWDVEQIEVFRGAQSTVQGRNALAGAVVVHTKDPTFDWTTDLRFNADNLSSRGLALAFGGPLIDNELAFRIAIDDQKSEGFISNPTLDDSEYGDSSNKLFRGKLLYKPAALAAFSALLTLSHSKNESGDDVLATQDPAGNPIDPFKHKVFSNVDGFENTDQNIMSLDLNYQLSANLRLESVTAYNRTDYDRQDDDDQGAGGGNNLRSRDNETDTFTQELRLHFEQDRWRGLVGAYYFDQDQDDQSSFTSTIDLKPLVGGLAPFYSDAFPLARNADFDVDIENWAVFADLEFDVTEKISIFGGVRYDNEKQDYKNVQETVALAELPDPAGFGPPFDGFIAATNAALNADLASRSSDVNSDADFSAFLPKAGFTVNWDDDLSTSFTVQRGYRAGGADLSPGALNEYDEEYTTNYEVAFRSMWLDNRLSLNANIFYTDWKDQQVLVEDAVIANLFHTQNAGESELYGAEIELNAQAATGLNVFVGVGFVKTKFKDFTTSGQDFSGNSFINAPEWTASTGVSKRWFNGLIFSTDVTYQDSSYGDAANTDKLDSRTIVNSRIGYELEHFSVSLFARNLFDEEYITRIQSRTNTVKVGEPRVIGIQLNGYW